MYQAGTLSGNPLAMSAGIATLQQIRRPGTYERLSAAARYLSSGFEAAGKEAGVTVQSTSVGSMWGFFFTETLVTDYGTAKTADTSAYSRFFHAMLSHGVYLAPSQFEAAFVSTAHGDEQVEATLVAARSAMFLLASH
jgi:glutamate-1-semialdehyde 2,1-aminomutase